MKIKFSRHAKRRGKLYNIPETTILKILEGKTLSKQGIGEIVENAEGFKCLLKIVFALENDIITVITNYPLKKGRKL